MSTFTDFRMGLLDPATPVPNGLVNPAKEKAGKRYDVYRNNVTVSLIEAMHTAFPLVAKLIGAEHFDRLAGMFVRAHPPSSPLMMFYGAEFPRFLERFDPLRHVPYLPDAARLDLGFRTSYHAADTAAFDASPLETLSPEALMEATFTLAPATQIIPSEWPLYDIWQFNQDSDAPKPRSIAQAVLITRPEFDPAPHALPPGGDTWLNALKNGVSFEEAHAEAAVTTSDFDLTESLTLALSAQAFAALHHKDLA